MSESPVVLVLSSNDSELSVVTPVLAALEANGSSLRALDTGRQEEGAVGWVLRTLSGEEDHSALSDELSSMRPDVAVCFDPHSAKIVSVLRKEADRLFPIVAVVPELQPSPDWVSSEAERFFVVDDEAAVSLEDMGVPGQSIVPVGGMGAFAYAYAGRQDKVSLKKRFGVSGRVALVRVDGLGGESSAQLAMQLSLNKTSMTYLFDAGQDNEAAAALRGAVPRLGMKAKLFGKSDDAPLYWRCSDVVIATPTTEVVHRSVALALPLVCLEPQPGTQSRLAEAILERDIGAISRGLTTVVDALADALSKADSKNKTGEDGANTIADAVFLVGLDREEIVAERTEAERSGRQAEVSDATRFADWVDKSATPAGGLEDLGGGGGAANQTNSVPVRPNIPKLKRLLDEIVGRRKRVGRTIVDAQKESARWDREKSKAEKQDHKNMVERSKRNGDMERARMHSALSEMAELSKEEKDLERAIRAAEEAPAPMPSPEPTPRSSPEPESEPVRGGTSSFSRPSVDEELERMRRNAGDGPPKKKSRKRTSKKKSDSGGVDDALAALKRKMAQKRKK